MARAARITYPGAYYHVNARGNRKADIFRSERDRRLFLARLGESCIESSLRCLAYCLMSNHYHLVLRTDEPGLSRGMQTLNARYAEHFNLAYELTGHVFQGRYHANLIESEPHLLEALRYVELNPVRAGLCALASEWAWSSYGAVVGLRSHTEWFDRRAVLALFASDPTLAVSRFAEFVAQRPEPGRLGDTPKMHAQRERDHAIREAQKNGGHSIRKLAAMFGVSVATIDRALKCYTKGSDPSV